MERPEILGLRLTQWGFLALAAIFAPLGWGIVSAALRLNRRARRAGMVIALLLVAAVALLMVVTAN